MLQVLLGHAGYDVAGVATAADALAMADEQAFDLYILDIRLPDGSGIDLHRQLREHHHSAPVIYLTAALLSHHDVAAMTASGAVYLTKPVQPAELIATVQRLLS